MAKQALRALVVLGTATLAALPASAQTGGPAPSVVSPTVTRESMQSKSDALRAQAEEEQRRRRQEERRKTADGERKGAEPDKPAAPSSPPSR